MRWVWPTVSECIYELWWSVPPPCGLRNVISPSLLEGRGAYVLYDLSLPGGEGSGGIFQSPELTSSVAAAILD